MVRASRRTPFSAAAKQKYGGVMDAVCGLRRQHWAKQGLEEGHWDLASSFFLYGKIPT